MKQNGVLIAQKTQYWSLQASNGAAKRK